MSDTTVQAAAKVSTGVKYDTGKDPWHLLPFDAVGAIVKILAFGANKYTINYKTIWDRLLDVPTVEGLSLATAKGNVVVVTKKSSDELILSLPNGSEKTVGIGKNEILTKLRGTPNVGKLIQDCVNGIIRPNGLPVFASSNLAQNCTNSYAETDAKFVEAPNTLTLTIVTRQGSFVDYFAHDVTTDWVFWETIWKGLSEQFNISRPLNVTGQRNWEAGMDWSRPFSALQRHMTAWWMGEGKDPETGMSHLAHAGCCVLFLIAYELRGIGTDDRPRIG